MSFTDYIRLGTDIVQIKPRAIADASGNRDAFGVGIGFIAIGGAAVALGSWNLPGLILLPTVSLIVAFLLAGLVHLMASLFGGEAEFLEFFRPLALSYVLDWVFTVGLILNVIPLLGQGLMTLLGAAVGLWKLVVDVFIVERVYGLNRGYAILVMILVTLMCLFLIIVTSTLFGAALLSIFLLTR